MKRVMTLAVVLVMALTLCVPAFATLGSFVQSPSWNDGIMLMNFEHDEPNCVCELIITAYKDRDTLSAEQKADIEAAYSTIVNNTDLTNLVGDITKVTGEESEDLAISDLFFAHVIKKNRATSTGEYTVTIAGDTLDNMETLIRYEDGKWSIVEDAKILSNGNLEFTVGELGAFAVVVNTNPGSDLPDFGDVVPFIVVGLMVTAAAVIVFLLKNRKRA